jgi:hypothetical protein
VPAMEEGEEQRVFNLSPVLQVVVEFPTEEADEL